MFCLCLDLIVFLLVLTKISAQPWDIACNFHSGCKRGQCRCRRESRLCGINCHQLPLATGSKQHVPCGNVFIAHGSQLSAECTSSADKGSASSTDVSNHALSNIENRLVLRDRVLPAAEELGSLLNQNSVPLHL